MVLERRTFDHTGKPKLISLMNFERIVSEKGDPTEDDS